MICMPLAPWLAWLAPLGHGSHPDSHGSHNIETLRPSAHIYVNISGTTIHLFCVTTVCLVIYPVLCEHVERDKFGV
jgi:hypothetical protein